MILDSVIENLGAEGLLQPVPRTHLVLGYSGGADSTALLFLLGEIKQKLPLEVTAAYFNHRWRGSSPEELPLVHANCQKAGVPLVIVQADLTLPQTENAARQARYQQLTHLAHDLHAHAVLTAHHADDQIETLIFRLLRGTGIDGLSGIQKRLLLEPAFGAPVPILRPLLDISRKTLREYTQEHQLKYFDDPTNQDTKRQRNHIRKNILPALEEAFPHVKNSLFRLTLVAEGDMRIIDEAVQTIWREVYGEDSAGAYLEAVRFNQLGLPYQRRVLKQFLSRQDIFADFQTIEDLLLFIRGEGRKNLDAALKSMVRSESGQTRFLSLYKNRLRLIDTPEKPQPLCVTPVAIPGPVELPALNVSLYALPWVEPEKIRMSPIRPNDNQQVYVNLAAFMDKPLELRNRKPGDKFQPIGMSVPLRLKKFLINRGVPRFKRDTQPVLAHGNQILWAPGLGISQLLTIQEKASPTHLLKLLPGLNHPFIEMKPWQADEEEERPKLPPPDASPLSHLDDSDFEPMPGDAAEAEASVELSESATGAEPA